MDTQSTVVYLLGEEIELCKEWKVMEAPDESNKDKKILKVYNENVLHAKCPDVHHHLAHLKEVLEAKGV